MKCWIYPSNSSETFKILFFHQNNQFEAKAGCFADFSVLTKIAVPDHTGLAILLVVFFLLSISHVENTPSNSSETFKIFILSSKQSVWSKNSMFCGLFNFHENRCIRTLPAWPFCWSTFLVEFLKCWKYPSNSSETFKILFFHQKNQFEAKTACFADFSILKKIAVSGPYRRGILLVDFFGWVFQMLKLPFQFIWNIQNFVLSSKQSVWSKNSMFCGLFNFDQNRCIWTLPAWPFCWLIFLVEFFKCWKYPSNSSETFKILFFHQNNQFEAKTACFADFSILTKIAVSGPYRRGHFCWSTFLVEFFKCWKYPSISSETLKNFVLSSKQSVWSKNSMFCGLFIFDQNRRIRTLPAWPFCWLIFFVEFFKIWKCPSNSSEIFRILFFHQNNQFEGKTACFADFSILTKIAVSGPYRRGHFVSWFFWLSFPNIENTLRILLKYSKFCSFIKTISLRQKQHFFRTFQFWPKSLYPDLTSVAILLDDLIGWFFEMLNIPFQFFWKIQNFVLSSKQSVWRKNSMFCGLFNFDENRCIRTLPAWPFGLLIFFVEFFQMLKIPFEFFWNIQNFVLSSKESVWSKNSMFCGLFNFDKNRCIRTLPAWPFWWLIFFVEFSKCWKYPSNSSETFKICSFIKTISLKQKQHVLQTFQFWPKSLYPDITGVAILLVDFFGWVFQMLKIPFEFFWNIPNFVLSSKQSFWRKNSMFCRLFNFDKNRCIRTLPAWPFCWLIFLVEFSKCWKYPSNSSETFKILFFHQNNQSEAKTACFADFSILTKIAVSGHYRRGHFVGWFFWLSFSNVENTLRILLKHSKCFSFLKTISLKQKQHVLRTFQFWQKSQYPDITGVAILMVDFFCWVFQMLKVPFEFFWNIQNFVLSSKQSVWSKNSMFCRLFNFDQNRCIGTSPAWPFCWLIFLVEFSKCWKYPSNSSETFQILFFHQNNHFEEKTACFADFSIFTKIAVSGHYRRGHFVGWFFWLSFPNVESTLRILLKHSKFCSFIKTIILKQKQHVLRTFQFWQKSLYPDITGVAILMVDFFGWVFQMLKIPFEFFWNIPNFVLSSKQSFWRKNSMFCGLFNFHQNRCIRTLPAWPFCWLIFLGWVFQMLKVPFEFFWNIPNFVLSSKQSFWSKNSMFCGLFNFDQNRCIRTLPAWPFCWLIFSIVENTLRILLKHSKYCSFIKTISLKQKQHVLRTFQFWRKSRYPDLTGVAILLVDFLWLSFSIVENTLRILLKHSKFCSFIKTISWKQKQHVLRTFQFWPKSLYPDITGVAIFLVEFFNCWNTLPILLKHPKFCSFIKTISLKQKQHVLRTFHFWPKSPYPYIAGVAILLVNFFCWVF